MPERTCSIESCEEPAVCRGWCNPHYQRWYAYGDPEAGESLRGAAEERFWFLVDKNGPLPPDAPHLGGCWLWGKGKRYGQIRTDDGGHVGVHRFAYELLVGRIPDGLEVDHLCFIPRCVNPAHLEAVTQEENTRRRRSRHRHTTECPHGHPYNEANTFYDRFGHRRCRACNRARAAARAAKRTD